jgi:hypothetical protein
MDASARNRNSPETASAQPLSVETLSRLSGRSVDSLRELASSTDERRALVEQLLQNPTISRQYGRDVGRLEREVDTILETLESKGNWFSRMAGKAWRNKGKILTLGLGAIAVLFGIRYWDKIKTFVGSAATSTKTWAGEQANAVKPAIKRWLGIPELPATPAVPAPSTPPVAPPAGGSSTLEPAPAPRLVEPVPAIVPKKPKIGGNVEDAK